MPNDTQPADIAQLTPSLEQWGTEAVERARAQVVAKSADHPGVMLPARIQNHLASIPTTPKLPTWLIVLLIMTSLLVAGGLAAHTPMVEGFSEMLFPESYRSPDLLEP